MFIALSATFCDTKLVYDAENDIFVFDINLGDCDMPVLKNYQVKFTNDNF